jgi:5-formyltetrahydrofolate cyclo-ligase
MDRMSNPEPNKDDLRRDALARRDRLADDDRTQRSAAIRRRFLRVAAVRRARTLFCYAPFRTEVDTVGILRWALRRGLVTAVPRILGPRRMVAVRIADVSDLRPGHWDIPEPRPGLPLVEPDSIDVAVLPGAAFDSQGGRVGYGGGFYDTFMRGLPQSATRIAIAFDDQVVGCVPCEAHDLRAHLIVTERRVVHCGRVC